MFRLPAVNRKILGYPQLMKAGLGNMLIPWAKCYIWCKDNNATMISPFWTKFRIGPYLRNERDKRNYQRLFKTEPGIGGLKRLFYLAATRKCDFEQFENGSLPSTGGFTIIFCGMNSFHELVGRDAEIKKALITMTRPQFCPKKPERPFIGIHVRLGDYAQAENPEDAAWTSRLPLEWYQAALNEVRLAMEFEMDAVIFSDGRDDELAPLLGMPGVTRSRYRESISDILYLSEAAVIIGSCSSFSMWGAFLAQTFTIWHRGRCPGKIMVDEKDELFQTEWKQGEIFPVQFRAGLGHLSFKNV